MTSNGFTGLAAEFWDLRGDSTVAWDDRTFFHELIQRHGDPVLDVGCGTGRLLFDFLAHGWDVDGIDISPDMLEICEHKADALGIAIDVYAEPMEELDLPREYGTIIVSSSGFQLIVDPERARRAIRRFKEHLRPGGVLAMPFTSLDAGEPLPIEMPDGWTRVTDVTRTDGTVIRRSSKSCYDPVAKLEHREDLYEIVIDGTVAGVERHDRSPVMRYYDATEVIALYREAGFHHLELLDPATVKPIEGDSPLYVAVGQNV